MPAAALFRLVASPASDGDLLRRFTADRDADAFAELVRRHGPVVYRVCRRLLGTTSADDAFQATFLILATRPGSVRKADSIASWLIGVAGRVARQMRKRDRRAAGVSRPSVHASETLSRPEVYSRPAHAARSQELEWSEQFRILDEELTRLPDRLRGPVVACLLQGRTQEQAARELGGSVRTIRRRLDEAKRLLRVRLERRGVVPAVAAGLAAGLGEAAATLPPHLPARTTETVFDFLAGGAATTAPPALIAKGVVMSSLTGKVKLLMATAALGLTALGVGVAGDGGSGPAPAEPKHPHAALPNTSPSPAVIKPVPPFPTEQTVNTGGQHTLGYAPVDMFGPFRFETGRMTVVGPTAATVRAIAHEAEFQRNNLSERWFGKPLPKSSQRHLHVGWKPDEPSSRSSEITFTKNVLERTVVRLHGPLQLALDNQLPHEMTRVVLAEHFGELIPRWADEGMACMAETPAWQAQYDQHCRVVLEAGRGFRLATLFNLTEYPKDVVSFAAQSHSVTRFLLIPLTVSPTKPTPDTSHQRFLQFVQSGTKNGWDQAAKSVYGFANVNALEEAWIAWLKTPGSRLAPEPPRPNKPAESEHIPPVKLSGGQ